MEVLEQLKKELNSSKDLQVVFYKFSQKLMNEYYLQIGDEKIELCEIEFYYNDEDKHHDKKTLNNLLQKETGNLFFHEYGMDITFGEKNYYGGILIRGIKYKCNYVGGPSNVVEYLKVNISDLYNKKINLVEKEKSNYLILVSIRKMGEKEKIDYLNYLYRFIREDYAQMPTKCFYKRSLPMLPLARAISTLTNITNKFEKQISVQKEIEKIKQNKDLLKNIQTFKDNL